MDTRTTGVQVPGTLENAAQPDPSSCTEPQSRAQPPALRGVYRGRLHPAPPPVPAPSPPARARSPPPATAAGQDTPSALPGGAHPGRRHRCARRSPESAPGVGVTVASGGVTGAWEGQWRVGIAPPLSSDWPAPESRGRGLGRRATAALTGLRGAFRLLLSASRRSCRVRRRRRHGSVSDGPRAA